MADEVGKGSFREMLEHVLARRGVTLSQSLTSTTIAAILTNRLDSLNADLLSYYTWPVFFDYLSRQCVMVAVRNAISFNQEKLVLELGQFRVAVKFLFMNLMLGPQAAAETYAEYPINVDGYQEQPYAELLQQRAESIAGVAQKRGFFARLADQCTRFFLRDDLPFATCRKEAAGTIQAVFN